MTDSPALAEVASLHTTPAAGNTDVGFGVLASQPSAQVHQWAEQLNWQLAHQARTQGGRATRIEPGFVDCLGAADSFTIGDVSAGVDEVHVQQHLMAFVLGPDRRTPQGFCTFTLSWCAPSADKTRPTVRATLNVGLEQFWVDPRGDAASRAELLAACVSFAAQRSLADVEQAFAPAPRHAAHIEAAVSTLSRLGDFEAFARRCQEQMEHDLHAQLVETAAEGHDAARLTVESIGLALSPWKSLHALLKAA